MSVVVNFEKRQLVKRLGAIKRNVKKTLPELIEAQGRVVAISMAKSTQPYGTGAAAKGQGERKTAADIRKVYASIGTAINSLVMVSMPAAKAFGSALSRGDLAKAQSILRGSRSALRDVPLGKFDGGALHQAAQNRQDGRVRQKTPSLIVLDQKSLDRFITKKQKLVGFAKSAWVGIARSLGSVRGLRAKTDGVRDITANWITRLRAPFRLDRQGWSSTRPVLVMTSLVRYGHRVLPMRDRTEAVRIARERLLKQARIAARHEARTAR